MSFALYKLYPRLYSFIFINFINLCSKSILSLLYDLFMLFPFLFSFFLLVLVLLLLLLLFSFSPSSFVKFVPFLLSTSFILHKLLSKSYSCFLEKNSLLKYLSKSILLLGSFCNNLSIKLKHISLIGLSISLGNLTPFELNMTSCNCLALLA